MANAIEFVRSGNCSHGFTMPLSAWSAGGTLYFIAKEQPDDDPNDTKAVINKPFSDDVATVDSTAGTVRYQLDFVPADVTIAKIPFANGSTKAKFKGQFKFVSADGVIQYFPANDKFYEVNVYANLRNSSVA